MFHVKHYFLCKIVEMKADVVYNENMIDEWKKGEQNWVRQ